MRLAKILRFIIMIIVHIFRLAMIVAHSKKTCKACVNYNSAHSKICKDCEQFETCKLCKDCTIHNKAHFSALQRLLLNLRPTSMIMHFFRLAKIGVHHKACKYCMMHNSAHFQNCNEHCTFLIKSNLHGQKIHACIFTCVQIILLGLN